MTNSAEQLTKPACGWQGQRFNQTFSLNGKKLLYPRIKIPIRLDITCIANHSALNTRLSSPIKMQAKAISNATYQNDLFTISVNRKPSISARLSTNPDMMQANKIFSLYLL